MRALSYMAARQNGRPIQSHTIADEMQIPKNFLSKILHRLVRAGIIQSLRGTHGGFRLAKSPKKIKLREVIDLFMNLDSYRQCFLGLHECDGSCRAHHKWEPIRQGLEQLLDYTTIDEL